jgi:hypothetical protein
MAVYVGLSLVGIMAFIVARPAFEMLSLSDGYAAATSDAQRSAYLAAGEATLAVFPGHPMENGVRSGEWLRIDAGAGEHLIARLLRIKFSTSAAPNGRASANGHASASRGD